MKIVALGESEILHNKNIVHSNEHSIERLIWIHINVYSMKDLCLRHCYLKAKYDRWVTFLFIRVEIDQ